MEKENINNIAIFSLVAGVLSVILGLFGILGIIFGAIAIILAVIAFFKKNESIMWIIGIILAIFGITVSFLTVESKKIIEDEIDKNILVEDTEEKQEEKKEVVKDEMKDMLSGNSWLEEDGSFLVLNDDGTFKYYRDQNTLDNYYYTGDYKVFVGENAVKYIANELEKYGITEKEQYDFIKRNEDYDIKDYYCLILNNEECIINGENTLKNVNVTPYMGMYHNEHDILDIANMNTGTYYMFKKVSE